MSGFSFKMQFYKLEYSGSLCEFIDGLSLKKMLITVSNCAVDSPHAFQDGSPNPLEPFKVSALIRHFQSQGVLLTFERLGIKHG